MVVYVRDLAALAAIGDVGSCEFVTAAALWVCSGSVTLLAVGGLFPWVTLQLWLRNNPMGVLYAATAPIRPRQRLELVHLVSPRIPAWAHLTREDISLSRMGRKKGVDQVVGLFRLPAVLARQAVEPERLQGFEENPCAAYIWSPNRLWHFATIPRMSKLW
jgi:hypothetical protein